MSVTGVTPGSREPLFSQVGKIASSDVLRGSESLCRLLRYLADQSIERPGLSVKEYQIATEVFGRPADFDPRLDSTVRVQTSRLRSKLAEYYANEGADDRMILEIPKGSYALAVHPRPGVAEVKVVEVPTPMPAAVSRAVFPANVAIWALSFLCGGLLLAIVYMTISRPAAVKAPEEASAALRTFWRAFTDTGEQPWVIYSNAEFVGRPETGMRYFDAARDDRGIILDHYTGVGEVIAIHELDRLFTLLHHGLLVKRGRLLSLDDAKNNDLIFVGSPSENLTLRDVPMTQDFVFRNMDRGQRKGDLAIVNLRPGNGEEKNFFASPGMPLTEDYALIGLVPGMTSTHWVMILAGTTTIGTQAAVEFVCRTGNVEKLLKRIGRSGVGEAMPFEAVIRVKVSRGVPVGSELVALHTRGA